MRSKDELRQMDINNLLHPIVTLREHEKKGPRIIVEGEGLRVQDTDGREYIDAFSGLWNVLVGHGQKQIAEASIHP